MRILLLSPEAKEGTKIGSEASWPPLGLLYVATVLKNSGHYVRLIDNSKALLSTEELVKCVKREDPQIVGISSLTPDFRRGIEFAQAIKKELPDVKIVFGNYHSTFTYDKILRTYPEVVDYVVLGYGEQTFLELVGKIENGGKVKNVRGIALRKNNKVVKTEKKQFIDNISDLPIPDRSLLEYEYRSDIASVIGSAGKFTTVLTSRGCPFNCTFCACAAFSRRNARFRYPEEVVEELEQLNREGYDEVGFVDDNFLLRKKRVKKIADLIIEKDLDLDFWVEGRVDLASREVLNSLSKAGCRTVYFGLESGSQKVLNYYNKKNTPQLNRKVVKNSKKTGIENVIGSFIVGAPIEGYEDIRKTFDYILSLKGLDFPQMNILGLAPGTNLWNRAVEKGYLNEEKHWKQTWRAVDVFPTPVESDIVDEMVRKFYREFLTRPGYLFYQIARTLISKHRLKILKNNVEKRVNLKNFGDFM